MSDDYTTHAEVDQSRAFLDPRVKIEPLVDKWYAWPHLLAPVQQALHLYYRYLPAVKSFISAPQLHLAALEDPQMYGGPFLDLPESAVVEVREYIQEIESTRADALEFVRDLREFEETLANADGYSLDGFREMAPPSLKGRIELAYDLNNNAKIRFLEEILSIAFPGYLNAQEVCLHRTRDTERRFFLSTPRLAVPGGSFIRKPFNSAGIKMLCSSYSTPTDLNELAVALDCPSSLLLPYFIPEQATKSAISYEGEGVRIRHFGHATLLIEGGGHTILVDPTFARDQIPGLSHFVIDDLPPKIDVLLISHGHQDHFTPETLMYLRGRVGVVLIPPCNRGDLADPSLRLMLMSLGYTNVITLESMQSYVVGSAKITSLPFSGEHSDLDIHSKHCAQIEVSGRKICLLVDSDAIDIDVYKRISEVIRNPDVMFVGMECFGAPLSWLYSPLIRVPVSNKIDQSRRLSGANSQNAWKVVDLIKPKMVFVYAMGQEPWMKFLMGLNYTEDSIQLRESSAFLDQCRDAGLPAERLHLSKDIEL